MKNTGRQRVYLRLVAFCLTLLLAFYAIPTVIYAELADAIESATEGDVSAESAESTSENNNIPYGAEDVLYEVRELREESVKHFHLKDGSYVAAQYPHAVHYLDENGEWADIDNTLSESAGSVFANADSRIKFTKKITGNGELFTLKENGTKLTMSLVGAIKGTAGTVTNGADAAELTELQKMMSLEKVSASVMYENILTGVDLEYVARGMSIKENIIVKEQSDSYSYTFELKLNGLTATLTECGDIAIAEQGGALKYTIPAPIVYDSALTYAPAPVSRYSLENTANGKYLLTVTVDAEWMNADGRLFPVTVDPTIGTPETVETTFLSTKYPDLVNGNVDILAVNGNAVAYWRLLSLPEIASDAYISSSTMTIHYRGSAGRFLPDMNAYQVTSPWDISDFCYNKCLDGEGLIASSPIDTAALNSSFYYSFDITEAVAAWYNDPSSNHGIAIRPILDQNTTNGLNITVFLSKYSALSTYPEYQTSYSRMRGLEDYYSYTSQSLGTAGTGSINLATGNLAFVAPLVSTADSLMPYTASLVYNSSISNREYKYGVAETGYSSAYTPYGFKLTACETVLKKVNLNNETHYAYADADGTEHPFYLNSEDGKYYDDDGLQMVLTVNDTTVSITDDSKTTRTFVSMPFSESNTAKAAFVLSKIEDRYGNAVSFDFDSAYRPTKISSTPKNSAKTEQILIYYNSNDMLCALYNPATKLIAVLNCSDEYNSDTFTESGKYLRQITYIVGTSSVGPYDFLSYCLDSSYTTNLNIAATVSYNYTFNGYLTEIANNLSAQSLYYMWDDSAKVSAVSHYGGTTEGQTLTFSYGIGYTDVTSSGNDEVIATDDDIITRYTCDSKGKITSIYSSSKNEELYGASFATYQENDAVKNNIKNTVTMGGSSTSYLLNGNFESPNDPFEYWEKSGGVTEAEEVSAFHGTGFSAAKLSPYSTEQPATLSQCVYLVSGYYTLSMPIYNKNNSAFTATVSVYALETGVAIHTATVPTISASYVGEYSHFSTTFPVRAAMNCKVEIKVTSSAAYNSNHCLIVDQIMLDRKVGSSNYEMVTAGEFNYFAINSEGGTTVSPTEVWETADGARASTTSTDDPFGVCAYVTGAPNTENYIKQRVYEMSEAELWTYRYDTSNFKSNANAEYLVSAFAKAPDAVPAGTFAIKIVVGYYQQEPNEEYYIEGTKYHECYKETVEVTHIVEFNTHNGGWQFGGGYFTTERPDEDKLWINADGDGIPIVALTRTYDCVAYIDVYCEYSNQAIVSTAYFDKISLVNISGEDNAKYNYNEEGLLESVTTLSYQEYYEYDDNRNLTRIANSRGEIFDYVYDGNVLTQEVKYDYDDTDDSSFINYPHKADDPDSLIEKTPKTKTTYNINAYGLTESVITVQAEYDESGTSVVQKQGTPAVSSYYVYDTESGSAFFGALLKEHNGVDVSTLYVYDEQNGRLLATINEYENTGICYTYDAIGNLVSAMPATVDGDSDAAYTANTSGQIVGYGYNDRNLLNVVYTRTERYFFTYDDFGNQTKVQVGSATLATYEYNERNGKLSKVNYGNGFSVEYVYGTLENLTQVWYNYSDGTRECAYKYEYTAAGALYKLENLLTERTTVYSYDTAGKLLSVIEYSSDDLEIDFSSTVSYDEKNQVSKIDRDFACLVGTEKKWSQIYTTYDYEADGKIFNESTTTPVTGGYIRYTYDDYGRLVGKTHGARETGDSYDYTYVNEVEYSYRTFGEQSGYTDSLVTEYTTTVGTDEQTYTFEYDKAGNITKITRGGYELHYEYDDLNQLVKVTGNGWSEEYTYDNNGNILSVKKTDTASGTVEQNTYGYANTNWGDMLTSYNGVNMTYDAIGNPLSYYNGATFTWTGRRLTGATYGGNSYSFEYNDSGLRTSKTKNGSTVTYLYDGSLLISETTATYMIVYLYDVTGAPIGMQYREHTYGQYEWDIYYYRKNMQGDIIEVYSAAGTKLVSYSYDTWGNFTTAYYNGGASTAAALNPYTYRGYYYDSDLELYYMQSRYYDSNTGRFINADSALYHTMLGYNMFAYCNNNPVNYVDYTGESAAALFWSWLSGMGAVAATEPTPIGEILLVAGCAIIGTAWLAETVVNAIEDAVEAKDDANDPPKSITEPDDTTELDDNGKPFVKPGQQPTEKEGYIAPKGGAVKGKTNDGKVGWKDKNGNIWVPAPTGTPQGHGGGHWDVQGPKGGYVNVYPGGNIRGGKAPYPNIKIFP